jgi:hypothetical protein
LNPKPQLSKQFAFMEKTGHKHVVLQGHVDYIKNVALKGV